MKHNKALLSLGLICASTPLYSAKKPNIIFFLVDDYGWVDSEVAFGEEVYPHNLRFNTPNMKRLAEKGTILTNAYACPLSTPTRSSLMTGENHYIYISIHQYAYRLLRWRKWLEPAQR